MKFIVARLPELNKTVHEVASREEAIKSWCEVNLKLHELNNSITFLVFPESDIEDADVRTFKLELRPQPKARHGSQLTAELDEYAPSTGGSYRG